jgi:hypothetical protein
MSGERGRIRIAASSSATALVPKLGELELQEIETSDDGEI